MIKIEQSTPDAKLVARGISAQELGLPFKRSGRRTQRYEARLGIQVAPPEWESDRCVIRILANVNDLPVERYTTNLFNTS